ncbi:MAG: RNA polymerase sporulation sigma factor SigH [Lachnospiraceae bacterium]|nr:RNA polymerase sporulation sigma factor SigH [Lachnospiraceae bacterium]
MNLFEKKTDEELIGEIVAGNTAAMDFLMDKYKNLVRGKAKALFLVGADKEDLIQEGMIGLYKAIRDFDAEKEASFRSFAELCITRQMYTAIKNSNTKKNQPLNNYVSFDTMVLPDESEGTMEDVLFAEAEKISNPEQMVIDKESASVLEYTLVGRLSKMEREVLFYYLRDYNYNQIATALKKEPKAVDNALQRIKKKLTQVISEVS